MAVSRRQLIRAGLIGGAFALTGRDFGGRAAPATPAVPGFDDPKRWAGKTLRVGAWASDVQPALRKAIWQPFAAATGCTIREVTTDYGRILRTPSGGTPYADALIVDPVWAVSALAKPHLEVLRETLVATVPTTPLTHTGFSQPAYTFAVVSAYRRDGVGNAPPATWERWWDRVRFPQPRGLQRGAQNNFEFALMAAGTEPDDLYPIDASRAIDGLRAISGKIVDRWWDSGLEPTRWLAAGRCQLTSAWHFRVFTAQQRGLPVDVVWNQGILHADHWVIPAGSPVKDVAVDFLKYAATPQAQAALARELPLGPIDPAALPLIDAAIIPKLPSAPLRAGQLVPRNIQWWASRGAEATELFNDWLLGVPNG